METSFPDHITTVDQEEPPRQMGRGEDREPSRTISAGFPPRSGFVQPARERGFSPAGIARGYGQLRSTLRLQKNSFLYSSELGDRSDAVATRLNPRCVRTRSI